MGISASSEQSERVRSLFEEVVTLDGPARAARLALEPDPFVRREVEVLLGSHRKPDSARQGSEPVSTGAEFGFIADASDTSHGRIISHYHIDGKLGGGGMGVVYLAHDTVLGRQVALKFLPPELTRDSKAKERFIQEARAASALDHPNVAVIYEIGETPRGQLFIAMAYYEGETLQQKIERGPLAISDALEFAIQIAEGLSRTHARGIVHRDIKPANLIVSADGTVKILDFGLAKMADLHLTKTGTTVGTAAYMSPEQARGAAVDQRTDIWSLGVVLYEMITSARPFRGDYEQALIYSILHEEPAPLRERREDTSEKLERVVRRLLQKVPADRYQNTEELLTDLRGLTESDKTLERAVHSLPERPRVYSQVIRNAGAAIVLLMIVGVALYVLRGQNDETTAGSDVSQPISLAVLPLVNLSGDHDQEYFSEGMTDALISDLGTVGALRVISRTSIIRFKNSERPLPEIARDLNVSHIVEGSILHAEGRVRIVTRLVEAATDQLLWTSTHEDAVMDVLSLQREVARSIAREVGIQLTPHQRVRLGDAPKTNPAAHEAYLRGLYYWHNRPPISPAIESFERAIELDSTFALAYAMLGGCYAVGGGVSTREEAGRRAREAVAKALALDENTAEAYNALGWVNVYFDWNWEGADEAFQRAIQLNPSYADAYHRYAHYFMIMGRTEEAMEASRRARELSPLDQAIVGHHVWDLYMTRQYDSAIAYGQQILDADPDNFNAIRYISFAHEQRGQFDWILNRDADEVSLGIRGRALALAGRGEEAHEVLREMLTRNQQNIPIEIALLYTALGETDSAFEWLEVAYAQRSYPLPDLRIDPRYDPLRTDPRFEALLERMGLAK